MILTTLRATIVDLGFQHTYRQNPTEFSRKRTLSFPIIVVVGLINLFNRSIAVELTKLLGHLHGLTAPFCSKQAFSKQLDLQHNTGQIFKQHFAVAHYNTQKGKDSLAPNAFAGDCTKSRCIQTRTALLPLGFEKLADRPALTSAS